jgi:hypothetical protein
MRMDRAHDVKISFWPASGSSVGALDSVREMFAGWQTDRRCRHPLRLFLSTWSVHASMRSHAAGRVLRISVMAHPSVDAMLGYEDGAGMGNVSRARGVGDAAVPALRRASCDVARAVSSWGVAEAQLRSGEGAGQGYDVGRCVAGRLCTQRVVLVRGVQLAVQSHAGHTFACATPFRALAKISHVSRYPPPCGLARTGPSSVA